MRSCRKAGDGHFLLRKYAVYSREDACMPGRGKLSPERDRDWKLSVIKHILLITGYLPHMCGYIDAVHRWQRVCVCAAVHGGAARSRREKTLLSSSKNPNSSGCRRGRLRMSQVSKDKLLLFARKVLGLWRKPRESLMSNSLGHHRWMPERFRKSSRNRPERAVRIRGRKVGERGWREER